MAYTSRDVALGLSPTLPLPWVLRGAAFNSLEFEAIAGDIRETFKGHWRDIHHDRQTDAIGRQRT